MGIKPRITTSASYSLTMAMPKGRLTKAAVKLFGKAGYDLSPLLVPSRQLVRRCGNLRVLTVRSADVPAYVGRGTADIGIVGNDVLLESDENVYEPLDLQIGRCKIIVAEPKDNPVDVRSFAHVTIATKYPRITENYLQQNGLSAQIVKLTGSVELGALTGLADRIVDITETGETLKQNGLRIVDSVVDVSTRLIVNKASMKLKMGDIHRLIDRLRLQIGTAR